MKLKAATRARPVVSESTEITLAGGSKLKQKEYDSMGSASAVQIRSNFPLSAGFATRVVLYKKTRIPVGLKVRQQLNVNITARK
jgi:hypothetical protein